MRRQPGRHLPAALPIRPLLQRFGFLVLFSAAAGLMIMDRAEVEAARALRITIIDLAAPVLDALSRPIESVNDMAAEMSALLDLRAENARLREKAERLERWAVVAHGLNNENEDLRKLLNFDPETEPVFVTGRVVGDSGSPFVRTMLVNAGAVDGVKKGQAAVTGAGLVGHVVEAGRNAARILLLTDFNSRIPVMLEPAGYRAILAGDNSNINHLEFLDDDARIVVGERVVTSGDGGVLPPGLPVGTVASVSGNVVQVRPVVDPGRVEYVRLLDWEPLRLEPVPETPPATADNEPADEAGGGAPAAQ